MMDQTSLQHLTHRGRQLKRIWLSEGAGGVNRRVRRALAEWLVSSHPHLAVGMDDVLAADLSRPPVQDGPKAGRDEKPVLVWIVTPVGPFSGGHTTIYRMISYLQQHGYENRIWFYGHRGIQGGYFESVARGYYGFTGEFVYEHPALEDAHAIISTGWQTAYTSYNFPARAKRFYFVQDFEPYFYPVGSESTLAGNTYRMGFHAITAGRWLAEKLAADYGMAADPFEFGCDGGKYHLLPGMARKGIAFYARQGISRRGYELGILALQVFAARNPDVEIHLYGNEPDTAPPGWISHGMVSPTELNRIYNQCYAGLCLSLTNFSLVPHEMLAAGCIPVVNDARHNRLVLDTPYIRYANADPHALAAALEEVVKMQGFNAHSTKAAASVTGVSWSQAGAAVDKIFRDTITA